MIDPLGRHLGHATFETTLSGFKALLAWAAGFGTIALAGVEGTSAYGAGLTRFLTAETVPVVEVDRPVVRPDEIRASPTRLTRTPPPEPPPPGVRRAPRKPGPVMSNRSEL